jgi:hypothetical protein
LDVFITSLVMFGGLLIALAAPLLYMAWRRENLATARNFLIGAGVVAILCSVLAAVSERQVLQCLDAGNSDCVDSGAAGMQLLLIGLFAVAAWFNAFFMWRD